MKKIIILFFIIILSWALWFFNQTKNIIYQVKPNSNISLIAKELKQQNIIKSSFYFKLLAKFIGEKPKVGYYDINNIWQFLSDINNGNAKTGNITLIPGKTIKDYYKKLKEHKYIKTTKSLEQIMKELKIPKPYEGRFYPETYKFNYGDSAMSIFVRSYDLMNNKLRVIWQNRDKNNYIKTQYDLIILASIIEKESANNPEKPTIAGVFINRLNKNMRLQTDPSVIYALKQKYGNDYNKKLKKGDLKINSKYNTYKIKGLPIGAIAAPSYESLLAAAKPKTHQFYYFVAKNKNEHIFAKTYKEHKENINKYLK